MPLVVEVEGLNELIAAAEREGANAQPLMKAAITNSVNRIQSNARALAPHRTGTLQRSILTNVDYPKGEVTVNEKYGEWIENGTGIYGPTGQRITPKKAKALAWMGAGGMVFARSIKGMKARPFFKPGIQNSLSYISDQFTQVMNKIIEGLAK